MRNRSREEVGRDLHDVGQVKAERELKRKRRQSKRLIGQDETSETVSRVERRRMKIAFGVTERITQKMLSQEEEDGFRERR